MCSHLISVGATLVREGVAADEFEWVLKSAIESAGEMGLVAPSHDLRRQGILRGVDLFQEETGLMNPVGAPPLKGNNEVPGNDSDRWTGWLSFLNP